MPRLDISDGVPTLEPSLFAPESWGDMPSALDIAFGPAPSGASFVCPCCGGARHKLDYAAPVRPELSDLPGSAIIQNQSGPGGDTIPGGVTTTFTLAIGGSQTGFVNIPGDDDWFRVELVAGQSYLFTSTVNGAPGLEDPYLELYNASGFLIAFDDDAGPGRDAMLRFTATQTGTYYINARAWEPDTGATLTGGYQITAAFGAPQNPLNTIDLGFTAQPHIDVYFATADQTFQGATAFRSWTPAEMNSAMAALATYSAVTNLTFSPTSLSAQAEFILFISDLDPNVLGQFFRVGTTGYMEFAHDGFGWTTPGLQPGGVGWVTLIHEFGHALGLGHPHDNGPSQDEIMQGVIDPFDSFGTFLLNQGVFTTMGYNDGWTSVFPGQPIISFGSQATPMALDLGLLQLNYGADMSTNLGNTTYTLPSVNTAGTFFSCIWDAGGVDTIQANTLGSHCTIDLRSATLLNEIGGGGFVSSHLGVRGGFTIAAGAVIENARGATGADTLIGNDLANLLEGEGGGDNLHGNGGNDTLAGGSEADALNGGAGDDALVGGPGDDTLNGDAGVDRVSYADAPGAVTVSLALDGVEQNTIAAELDTLSSIEVAFGSSFNDTLTGGNSPNTLTGGAGDDMLSGGGHNDVLAGLGGADALNGGEGVADWATYAASAAAVSVDLAAGTGSGGDAQGDTFVAIENISGSVLSDTLRGGAGANALSGGAGADLIEGRAGADALAGGGGADTVSYASSSVGVAVNLSTQTASGGDATGDTLSGFENAQGSAFNDTLTGDAGANALSGGGRNDVLAGLSGADALNGGEGVADWVTYAASAAAVSVDLAAGTGSGGDAQGDTFVAVENISGSVLSDTLRGNAGANALSGGAGADLIEGRAGADALAGGGGADTFVYAVIETTRNSIGDFSHAQGDKIDLSAIDADPTTGANDVFAFSTTRTVGLVGEAVVTNLGASSLVSLYLDADNVADMTISVVHANGFVMDATDFVL